jgi:hypothetical protein
LPSKHGRGELAGGPRTFDDPQHVSSQARWDLYGVVPYKSPTGLWVEAVYEFLFIVAKGFKGPGDGTFEFVWC